MSDFSKIPTSFVPLPTRNHFKKSKQPIFVNVVDITIFSIFILSVFVALGMYVYQIYLYNQLANEQKIVQTSQQSTSIPVQKLITLNNRIITAQDLLNTHTTMSRFFDILSSGTPKNISLSSLNIILNQKDSTANIKAFGIATNFSALVAESRSIRQNPNISSINFSDISVNNSNDGDIKFSVSATLNKNIVENFSALIGSIATSTISQVISSSTPKSLSTTTTP